MSGRLEIRLGDLKQPWADYCRARNTDASNGIKDVINHLLKAEKKKAGTEPTTKPFETEPVSEKKVPIELRFTISERAAIAKIATAEGFTANAWIVALVRANLTNQPQFGKMEIEALGESNHQLLAIGRNLNQIAKVLNAAKGQDITQYDRELVEELAAAVRRHVTKVGDALRSCIYRWKLKDGN